jgi:hypothetical protein
MPQNDLDTLMESIERINAKSPDELSAADIDTLIHYHRRNRARMASGGKPLKPTVDLSAVMAKLIPAPPPVPKIRRL